MAAAVVLSISLHGLLLFASWRGAPSPRLPREVITNVEFIQKIRTPFPAPSSPSPAPPRPAAHSKRLPRRVAESPVPATASKVAARAEEPTEVFDLTSFEMHVGDGDQYAGSITGSSGTSGVGVEGSGATPKGAAATASLARPSAPARKVWTCRWPEDEEAGNPREVRVRIAVHVNQNGSAEEVEILDPVAPSFARAAQRCALAESYRPALDDSRRTVSGVTRPFVVHFVR